MSQSIHERRMAENEVIFRQYNESIEKGFEELQRIAKEDDQEALVRQYDDVLQFYCECSDKNCLERVRLQPSRYVKIHKNRSQFVIVCGHDTKSIERVVSEEADFCIVEKFFVPPVPVGTAA